MTLDELGLIRYSRMRWNTPLSEDHAALLLRRFQIEPGSSVLDLGCGWGELLIQAVQTASSVEGPARGIGVDTDTSLLERGRALAARRGLDQRIAFIEAPAESWQEPANRVMCIGASHAWGGTQQALSALRTLVTPGGRLLFGDGCWETAPTKTALAIFGDEVMRLPDVVTEATAAGWRVMHLSTADQREWDDFESTWRAGPEEWLAANPRHEQAGAVRDAIDARLAEYLSGYRGVLGFGYLILA
jgi:cyclopropane fatty-acyl-phospholipid synthase-like methyltransferase